MISYISNSSENYFQGSHFDHVAGKLPHWALKKMVAFITVISK